VTTAPASSDRAAIAETVGGGERPLLTLAIAILAISLTPVLYRLSPLGPTATTFYRTALALPVFLIWAWTAGGGRRNAAHRFGWGRDGWILIVGGLAYAANILAYGWALRFTQVANVSLLANLTPFFVAAGSFALFGERVSRGFILSMAAAIAGLAVLSGDRMDLRSDQLQGDGLAVLSAVVFAVYLVAIGRLGRRLGSAEIMTGTSLVASLALFAATLAAGEDLAPGRLAGWLSLLTLGVVSYGIGQGLVTKALPRIGASFAAVSLLCLPVSAGLYGWLLLDEKLTARQLVGGAVILGAILGCRLTARR
jgi:drug/metabolite transporter (DMT)-like permease